MALIKQCDICGKHETQTSMIFSDEPFTLIKENYKGEKFRVNLFLETICETEYQKYIDTVAYVNGMGGHKNVSINYKTTDSNMGLDTTVQAADGVDVCENCESGNCDTCEHYNDEDDEEDEDIAVLDDQQNINKFNKMVGFTYQPTHMCVACKRQLVYDILKDGFIQQDTNKILTTIANIIKSVYSKQKGQ
jgi:hypothetical protein